MATEIKMPQLGLTMEEGTVERWLKAEGDPVKAGEPLLEITTDKLTNEVAAETDGVLLKIVANLHPSAGHRAVLIRADGHELNVAHDLRGPHQIGHEDEGALQNAQKQGSAALILLMELCAQLLHPPFQLLLGYQYLQDILFHLTRHAHSPLSLSKILPAPAFHADPAQNPLPLQIREPPRPVRSPAAPAKHPAPSGKFPGPRRAS